MRLSSPQLYICTDILLLLPSLYNGFTLYLQCYLRFYGRENQILAIIKRRFNLAASFYPLLQIFSITLLEKIPLNKDFFDKAHGTDNDTFSKQLKLFNN